MAKLPTDLSGREVKAAFERAGFVFRRQTGSHMILRRDEPYALRDPRSQAGPYRHTPPHHRRRRAFRRTVHGSAGTLKAPILS